MQPSFGLHHFTAKKHQITFHRNSWVLFMDKFIYLIATFGPFLTLLQIIKIWQERNANGVSALAWSGYSIFSIFWLIYGLIHKEKAIIFANFLSFIFSGLVAIGAFLYG